MCQYDKADKRYKERNRAKNALQAIEIALWHEEGKNNGFKLNNFKNKTHTQETTVKGVCRCSADLNLRKNFLKIPVILPVKSRVLGVGELNSITHTIKPSTCCMLL